MKEYMVKIIKAIPFIVIGAGLLGEGLGIWNFKLFPGWWTLFIIVPAIIDMITGGIDYGNAIALAIGVAFLLSALGVFDNINIFLLVIGAGLLGFGVKSIFPKKKS